MKVIKACKIGAGHQVEEGRHMAYRISAPCPEEKEESMKPIKASISMDPFHDVLAIRKSRIAEMKESMLPQQVN